MHVSIRQLLFRKSIAFGFVISYKNHFSVWNNKCFKPALVLWEGPGSMLLTSCLTPCTLCLPPLYTICTPSDLLLSPYLHPNCHMHCTGVGNLNAILPCTCSAPQMFSYTVQDQHLSCSAPGLHPKCPVLHCLHLECPSAQYNVWTSYSCPPFHTRSPTLLPSSVCKRPYTEYPLVLHQTCNSFGLLNYTKLAHKYPLICTRSVRLLPSFPALDLHPELQSTGKLNTVFFDAPGGPASGASWRKEWLNKLKFFSNERGVNRDVSGEKIFKITSSQWTSVILESLTILMLTLASSFITDFCMAYCVQKWSGSVIRWLHLTFTLCYRLNLCFIL